MGKVTNTLKSFFGLTSTAPNFPTSPAAPLSPAASIRPTPTPAPKTHHVPPMRSLPPAPGQAASRANAQGTAVLTPSQNLPSAPNPYMPASSQVTPIAQPAPASISFQNNLDFSGLQSSIDTFLKQPTTEDLEKINEEVLSFPVKEYEFPKGQMSLILRSFADFILTIKPADLSVPPKLSGSLTPNDALNVFGNLLLMYNYASKTQQKVNSDAELKSIVQSVINYFRNESNKSKFNADEKHLIEIEIVFLDMLLTDSSKLIPNKNFYDNRHWDVNAEMIPTDRNWANALSGAIILSKTKNFIECLIAIRNHTVVLLNRTASGKAEYLDTSNAINSIYLRDIPECLYGTYIRMKAVKMITEIALRTDCNNMKNLILALLDGIKLKTYDLRGPGIKPLINTCMFAIERSRDEYMVDLQQRNPGHYFQRYF